DIPALIAEIRSSIASGHSEPICVRRLRAEKLTYHIGLSARSNPIAEAIAIEVVRESTTTQEMRPIPAHAPRKANSFRSCIPAWLSRSRRRLLNFRVRGIRVSGSQKDAQIETSPAPPRRLTTVPMAAPPSQGYWDRDARDGPGAAVAYRYGPGENRCG